MNEKVLNRMNEQLDGLLGKQLVVVKRKELVVFPTLKGKSLEGTYTVVTKCQAGFPTISTVQAASPYEVFRRYVKGAIMNISLVGEKGFNFTMYARMGKKVWACPELLSEITIGDINDGGVMYKTGLYSHDQYQAVNANTWADKAYVMN